MIIDTSTISPFHINVQTSNTRFTKVYETDDRQNLSTSQCSDQQRIVLTNQKTQINSNILNKRKIFCLGKVRSDFQTNTSTARYDIIISE